MSEGQPNELVPLTNETFRDFVRAHRFVMIHFWGPWNGSDHLMKKSVKSQIPEFGMLVRFATFDVDPPAHNELCREHNLLNVPFLALYRDGSLIRTETGMRSPQALAELLRELVHGEAN